MKLKMNSFVTNKRLFFFIIHLIFDSFSYANKEYKKFLVYIPKLIMKRFLPFLFVSTVSNTEQLINLLPLILLQLKTKQKAKFAFNL